MNDEPILYVNNTKYTSFPAATKASTKTPDRLARISIVTLSVSTTHITSSSLVLSPTSFDHDDTTAVVMESPSESSFSTTTFKA